MNPAKKESDSPRKEKNSQPNTCDNAPGTLVCATTGVESVEVCLDDISEGRLVESQESGVSEANPSMSVVTPITAPSECTEESEVSQSIDPNDSIGEISEDFCESGKSETIEAQKEVLSEESQRFASESDSCKVEVCSQSADEGIKIECKSGAEKISAKERKKDQYCQANCLPDKARSDHNEMKTLKEKLAISKKDTETMQKLLEDVRNDYEELQKNFERRNNEIKSKAFVEELIKENDEMRKEKAELNRKMPKKESKVSSASDESRSKEKRKSGLEKGSLNSSGRRDSKEMTCPCFAQSIRKIITDVTEDFKDTISLIKQSSAEQKESLGKELTKLKDEYMCALEKKDGEIHVFEEIIKGLQSRIRESEREIVSFRDAVSSAHEEKQKLYDDIRVLKDELLRAQHESEKSCEDLERIKYGLKKFCTAEEYEELQRLNFRFSGDAKVEGTPARQSDSKSDVAELQNKVVKFYPVLKKAKKEITKLKEGKQDVENRLQVTISQATEKEQYLNKKLNKASSELKQSENEIIELKKQLVALKLHHANIDELQGRAEDLRRKHGQELKTVKDKLKISNDRLVLCQGKYDQLQEDHKKLRDRFNDLKKVLDDLNSKKLKEILDYSSDNDDSSELPLKGEAGYLQIENEDLREEIRDHQALIKQLLSKKKEQVRTIKMLREENTFLKAPLIKASDEHKVFVLDSDDYFEREGPGLDGTSTQEHRVRFNKNGKQLGCSVEEEDSALFVHFPDDNNELHTGINLAEILDYDTSISEKE